ncbi:MAG: FtsX-like permease family protein [Bacteroidota bacterium]
MNVVYRQVQYTRTMHLGYNQEFLIRMDLDGALTEKIDVFIEEAVKLPGVQAASVTSSNMLGQNMSTTGIGWTGKAPDDRIPFELYCVDHRIFQTMELEFAAGRGFDVQRPGDASRLVLNQRALAVMGEAYDDPIGKTMKWWGGEEREIIGVVKNFHFETVHEDYKPAAFLLMPENANYLMVRIEPSNSETALAELETLYHQFNPGYTFLYDFMDDAFERQYRTEQQVAELSGVFAVLAGLISCLGLVGLVAFTTDRRRKEIGVRKVLGSEVWQILVLINREFTLLVGAALLIALPVSYLMADWWLAGYAFHANLPWMLFLIVGLLSLGLTWAVVGVQSLRAARMNPVSALQDE